MGVYVEPVRSDFWQLFKEPGESTYDDPLGPKNCMTYSAARLVTRSYEGKKPAGITGVWPPTGEAIRRYCVDAGTGRPDVSGGVHHGQIARVLRERYDLDIELLYGDPFDDVLDSIDATHPAMISVWYRRIRDTPSRRGSFTFYQNHELFVNDVDRARGVLRGVVDPLADGRQTGLYRGPGEYPISLVKAAAGELNISSDPNGYRALGAGRVYAAVGPATGAAPIVVPPTVAINYGGNTVVILDRYALAALKASPTLRRVRVQKGQPIYRSPNTTSILTRPPADMTVMYVGTAARGWRSVVVQTANFADRVSRVVEAYVPIAASPLA
jgi:hypothetical protein